MEKGRTSAQGRCATTLRSRLTSSGTVTRLRTMNHCTTVRVVRADRKTAEVAVDWVDRATAAAD